MVWVRLEDTIAMHPKLLSVSAEAAWLYVAGICYANQLLTDGRIKPSMVSALAPTVREPIAAAAELKAAGLWHKTRTGDWEIHDYADYQPSSEHVRAVRERDRARKASARNRNGTRTESKRRGIQAESNASRAREPQPQPAKAPPSPPKGGRTRDRERFAEELRDYVSRRYRFAPTATQAIHAVKQAVTHGKATTNEQVDDWIRRHFPEIGEPA